MTSITPYLYPLADSAKRIDPTKVLLIINSNSSFDVEIVNYYQSIRGLSDHRLSFSLAQLTDSVNFIASVITPIADYIIAHGIEAVISAPGVPVGGNSSVAYYASRTDVALDPLFGAAVKIKLHQANYGNFYGGEYAKSTVDGGGRYTNPSGTAIVTDPAMTLKTPDGFGYRVIKDVIPLKSTDSPNYGVIGWGRLGCPYWNDAGAVNFGVAKAQTYADTKRMIDDCIFAEKQAITSKVFALGFGDYVQNGTYPWQWYAWQFAKAAGINCKVYTNEYAIAGNRAGTNGDAIPNQGGYRGLPAFVRDNLIAWLGQATTDYDSESVRLGTATIAADYYAGSAYINDGIAGIDNIGGNPHPAGYVPTFANYCFSLKPKRGAWAFNWCSAGMEFVENVIRQGGAAGIGPVIEPYTIGLPDDASVMSLALKGFSLAEILLYSCVPAWAMTAYGDPLYRPFPAPGFTDGSVMSLLNTTPVRNASLVINSRSIAVLNKSMSLSNTTPKRTVTWQA
jgi:hypothetical protein